MKNLSLQDQLLNAGLTNKTKVKQVRAEKRKQSKKQQHNKEGVVDETKQQLKETKAKQLEKDKLLNLQRNKKAEEKQIKNQIIQLINLNKLPKEDEGIAYNFTHQNKVKTIYVNDETRNKIIAGRLAIVLNKSQYEVVPVVVAEKIKQRGEEVIIVLFTEKTDSSESDDYQDYEIPDDLMW
jgi:uncharacterized protein YaiL (DUF2058 family)